jgi:hypothetical protein
MSCNAEKVLSQYISYSFIGRHVVRKGAEPVVFAIMCYTKVPEMK